MPEFRREYFGEAEIRTLTLSRRQVLKLAELAEKHEDQSHFHLRVSNESGIGPTITVGFDLDITDVAEW